MKRNSILAIVAVLAAGSIAVPAALHSDHEQYLVSAFGVPIECGDTAVNPCPNRDDLCCAKGSTCVKFVGGQLLCFTTRPDKDLMS